MSNKKELVYLSRAEILGSNDTVFCDVPVPEWKEGGKIRVRNLEGDERDLFEVAIAENKDTENLHLRARLVALGCVDAEGKRLFESADLEALGKKSAAPLSRLAAKIRELSGMDISAKEAAKN